MRRLLSREGVRYTCKLLTENSKRAFLMLVTKIQRMEIKNLLITKKTPKKRRPQAAFSMNQSSVLAIHSEGKGRIPVSVACFNYSIAEV